LVLVWGIDMSFILYIHKYIKRITRKCYMNKEERLNLKKLISANEYEDNTEHNSQS